MTLEKSSVYVDVKASHQLGDIVFLNHNYNYETVGTDNNLVQAYNLQLFSKSFWFADS